MDFNRHIYRSLEEWKSQTSRKPLIIRGARQVGKTTLVKLFGKTYRQFAYLNLEKKSDKKYFEAYENVENLVEALFLELNFKPNYGQTLLFIDEIQEVPQAIQMLRYFYEEFPELHVITAGSLLEFSLGKVQSFPVGRVSFMYLFPLNFVEFLQAIGHEKAFEQLNKIPLSPIAHNTLMNLFHKYVIIGGMPEIIQAYNTQENISSLPEVYESIWSTYKTDVEKYAKNETDKRIIRHIMANAHNYLDERITFQNFGNSNYRSREVGEAFRALDDAKVIQLIYPTTETRVPAKINLRKKPRMQFLDTGLVNHALHIQHELLGLKDMSNAYKGAIIPHLITQELISTNIHSYQKPVFWVREKSQSSAEVDLIFRYKDKLIPIEIKSGQTGKLRSLHQFMENSPHHYAIRIYGGILEITEAKTTSGKVYKILNLPYYLGTKIHEYIHWFIEQ